jgi:DNA-binding response OmpR family regulator/nitrogen-specific signal transduction histidine kinase
MLSPLESAEGTLVTAAIRDISVRRRVERLKDEFVSTVSHELRTPMTSISGSLSLLVGQWASVLPGSAARLLAIANKNSQRLVRLINDILDIEKLEAGRVVFNLSRVDLRQLIKQAIEANRGFAEGYSVRVRLDATSVDAEVNADPDRLAQVLTNLLSNAIKFSPPGEEVPVTIDKNGDMIRISVRDHGGGIPPDFKPHVFEKFSQADATSSKEKGGTGLGLSIVKQIVERLHGDVGFNDAPGGGTIFYVDLPACEAETGWELDLEAPQGSTRILLCEDERETAVEMRKQLRQAGFAADFAFTATAARTRAGATLYAAILVDLQLPDGDGISLILSLRTQLQYQDTPIIVVSIDPIRGRDDVRSPKLNVLSWFSKPVDFHHLVLVLTTSIASEAHKRPCILHVDDDRNVLTLVAQAFSTVADVVSVDSIKAARRAIVTNHFDIALLDVSLGANSGLDLLPDLRKEGGDPIPVVVLSAHGISIKCDEQVQVVLVKSQASLKSLVEIVCDRLTHKSARTSKEVA